MKLSPAILFLLSASSFNKNLEECAAAQSDLTEGAEEVGALLRGGNNNIIMKGDAETKKVFAGEDRVASDMMTVEKKKGREEQEDDTHRQLHTGIRWTAHCSEDSGMLSHLDKCGGDRGECCDKTVHNVPISGNANTLVCRKKNSSSDYKRCHEIHTDNINWSMLCKSGRTHKDQCGAKHPCCSEVVKSYGYTMRLEDSASMTQPYVGYKDGLFRYIENEYNVTLVCDSNNKCEESKTLTYSWG